MDSTQTHFMFLSASHGRSEINLINCEKWTNLGFDNLCWDEDQGVKISGTSKFISLVFQRLIPSLSNFVNSFNEPKGKFWTSGCSSSLGLGLLMPNEVVINQKCPSSPFSWHAELQGSNIAILWRMETRVGTANSRLLACGEGTGVEEEQEARDPGLGHGKAMRLSTHGECEVLQRMLERRHWRERSFRIRTRWRCCQVEDDVKASCEEHGRYTPATGNSACARVAESNARRLGSVQQITHRRHEKETRVQFRNTSWAKDDEV